MTLVYSSHTLVSLVCLQVRGIGILGNEFLTSVNDFSLS